MQDKIYSNKCEQNVKSSYEILLNAGITRKVIKKVIMTKSYSAAKLTIAQYIKHNMISHYIPNQSVSIKSGNTKEYNCYNIKVYSVGNNVKKHITYDDIIRFVDIINETLYLVLPRYALLERYIKSIVKIFYLLNIAITWILPSGANTINYVFLLVFIIY